MGEAVRLHSISPEATPEEVAAILAAIAASQPVPVEEERDDDRRNLFGRRVRCDRAQVGRHR